MRSYFASLVLRVLGHNEYKTPYLLPMKQRNENPWPNKKTIGDFANDGIDEKLPRTNREFDGKHGIC